jgi:hypothetical protein
MDARVPIFAISSKSPSPRASEAIKSDMVKPMPQSQLAPKIWLQVTEVGRDPRPMRDARRANKVMPIGLPSSRNPQHLLGQKMVPHRDCYLWQVGQIKMTCPSGHDCIAICVRGHRVRSARVMSCCVTARKRIVLNVAVQIESLRILQIGSVPKRLHWRTFRLGVDPGFPRIRIRDLCPRMALAR